MKKLIGVFVVAAALMVLSVTPAQAAAFAPNGGPFCVSLTNFCDRISISTDASSNNFGFWDWTCNNIDWTNVLGQNAAPATTGTRPVAGGVPFNYTANFIWHVGPMTFDLWGTNGSSTFTFQTNQPFTFTTGKCSGSPANGLPRSVGR